MKNYTEIEVPTLSPVIIPEGYLGIFRTDQDFAGEQEPLFLTPHPELFLKRLLCTGVDSLFCIARCYRNNETSTSRHSPEFEMLEFYQIGSDYNQLASEVLGLLQFCAQQWYGSNTIIHQGKMVDLNHWETITVAEAFARYADIQDIFDHQVFFQRAQELGYKTSGFSYTDVWSQIYTDKVEPNLGAHGKPTLIKDYPWELVSHARWNTDKKVGERFEFYINGVELGNAASEQADHLTYEDLVKKYDEEMQDRSKNNLTEISADTEFPEILKNLPQCSGIGIGLERLCAVFLDLEDIRDLKVSWIE